ncbi:OprO/OprP family phosphate-selective porin [Acetobacter okinawensis]|uniref:OprO/OprP family phosphate-selective porin n=1 Tax=Acetobacter okinawensis TaxID=1076594 RepID=UPI000472095A|nr:porin [Acetobacter okinawensis]MBS0966623.1 porin [Acetobacter okinawensis]MBS0988238.1 porin [Acetobacter okinawensis]MCP1214225.1 OprO/OprP family phosphate-selective porin [Acetobacter okinawensis]
MATMRCNSLFSSVALTSFMLAGIAPVAEAASTEDSEIRLLRAEMSQMRRDMQQQIVTLKHQLAKSDATSAKGRVGKAAGHGRNTMHVADGTYDPNVQFGEQEPLKKAAPLSGVGTPPSDRGDTMSWKDFKAATASDEEVRIGGMIVGFPKGRFTVSSEDGAYGFSVGLAFHEDFGGFLGTNARGSEKAGDFSSFTENARRIRIPFTFRYKDWVANVTPDFGAGSADGASTDQTLYEANLNYTGFHNTILTVGYFQPRVTEEDSESSNDFEMMERPAITDAVRKIAAGDARFSFGGLHYEKRWWVAAYFTGQSFGQRSSNTTGNNSYGVSGIVNSQTGGTFRAAGRPYMSKDIDVHVGISAISAFKVAETCSAGTTTAAGTCSRSYKPGQSPEVNLTSTNLIGATISNASSVWSAGPELGFRWKKLLLKGEYYNIGINRDNSGISGAEKLKTVHLQGYYGSANYTLFGKGREYNIKEGAFAAPGVEHEFDPSRGYWGAMEITGRYSVTDFSDVAQNVNGGRQTVWSGGINWYPNRHFRFMLDFNHFIVSQNGSAWNNAGRNGNSLAARVQAAF